MATRYFCDQCKNEVDKNVWIRAGVWFAGGSAFDSMIDSIELYMLDDGGDPDTDPDETKQFCSERCRIIWVAQNCGVPFVKELEADRRSLEGSYTSELQETIESVARKISGWSREHGLVWRVTFNGVPLVSKPGDLASEIIKAYYDARRAAESVPDPQANPAAPKLKPSERIEELMDERSGPTYEVRWLALLQYLDEQVKL